METMLNWLLNLPKDFANAGSWLTTEIEGLGIAPLALLGLGGLAVLIGWKVIRLIV